MTGAVQWSTSGSPELEALEIDQPLPREVLIKTAAAGVCRSDLSLSLGLLPSYAEPPFVAGHEGAGIVVAVGSAVTSVQPGDLVVAALSAFCGHCHYCLSGHTNLCFSAETVRSQDDPPRLSAGDEPVAQCWNVSSFAEMMLVHESQAVKIPGEIPYQVAGILGCAVVTGMGAALRTARVQPGETVAVFGCGGVGMNAIQGARIAGARRVIAVDRVASKLELARTFGATDLVLSDPDPTGSLLKLTSGGLDHAIEVIGTKTTCEQAIASVHRGGTVTLVGMIPETDRISLGESDLTAEKHIQGCDMGSNIPQLDIPYYCDLYLQGRLKLNEMITRTIPLSELAEGFSSLQGGEVARTVILYA
jgi:S-(hydroxymethyl)glutathione dehydrogenase / alcohol dehydrogenase